MRDTDRDRTIEDINEEVDRVLAAYGKSQESTCGDDFCREIDEINAELAVAADLDRGLIS